MKKRLLTAWIIACMFICLVGQTPITALAEGDDTRVISVPEGLQEVLNYDMPETQTVQTEDTTEDGEVQTGTEDENGEGQCEDENVEGESGTVETPENQTVEEVVTSENPDVQTPEYATVETPENQTQDDAAVETPDVQTLEDATVETPETQTVQEDDSDVQTQDETTAEIPEVQTVQDETVINETPTNQTVQEETAVEETPENIEDVQQITETNLTASIVASDGNTYETNVTYTSESGIPMEGTVLKVTELVADDEGYDEYLEESASKVGVDTEDILFSKVFDIKIVDENDENIEYEPEGNVDVSIRIVGVSFDDFSNVNVLHFVEDKNDENYLVYDVETTVSEETVEFSTDSFSVYVVIGHEGDIIENPRVMFHFISYDENGSTEQTDSENHLYYIGEPYQFKNSHNEIQTTQILKNGESLELIADPGNLDNKLFYGWHVVSPKFIDGTTNAYGIGNSNQKPYYTWPSMPEIITFEQPIEITETGIAVDTTVHWSLNGASGEGKVDADGNVHVFLAPVYENYHFVNFMMYARDDELAALNGTGNNLMTRRLIALGSASTVDIKVSDIRSNSKDAVHLVFTGWEYLSTGYNTPDDTSDDTWVQIHTVDCDGSEIKDPGRDGTYLTGVSMDDRDNIDLYPIFVEARWVDFFSGISGSGAQFIGSRYLAAWGHAIPANTPEVVNENYADSFAVPVRQGYNFDGWYAFAVIDQDTGEITNLYDDTKPDNNAKPVKITYLKYGTGNDYTVKTVTVNTTAIKISDNTGNIVFNGSCGLQDNGDGTGSLTDNGTGAILFSASNGKLKFHDPLDRLMLSAKWESSDASVTIVYWTEDAQDQGYWNTPHEKVEDIYSANQAVTYSTAELIQLYRDKHNGSAPDDSKKFTSGYNLTYDDLLDLGLLTSGDLTGAVPTGEEKFYELVPTSTVIGKDNSDHDVNPDNEVTINGDGSSIFNVYFNRMTFKLVFHIGHDGFVKNAGQMKNPSYPNWDGNWIEYMYKDSAVTALGYNGKGSTSYVGDFSMTYNGGTPSDPSDDVTATSGYETTRAKVSGTYVPSSGEDLYVIEAKYGAYIGNRWPSPTNPNFTFTEENDPNKSGYHKSLYIWTAYYGSLYAGIANARPTTGGNNNGNNSDINGVYEYMSAELCSNRAGTDIINSNHVHHLVAYFGDLDLNIAPNRFKQYHILIEAKDGTLYDPHNVSTNAWSNYEQFPRTTWSEQKPAYISAISGKNFYELRSELVISNVQPQYQLGWELEGYDLVYSCYDSVQHPDPIVSGQNDYDVYFFYVPKQYELTFMFDDVADRHTDLYNYTMSLADAKNYSGYADPSKEGYSFSGWYTNEAGAGDAFDFSAETMPSHSVVLYPVFDKLSYVIKIDPNGGVIDKWRDETSASTGFRADYHETISSYNFLERNYIATNDEEISRLNLNTDTQIYYYMNAQYIDGRDGRFIPSLLRNALYLTASEIDDYWNYYSSFDESKFTDRGAIKFTDKNEWMDAYFGGHDLNNLQRYRETFGSEKYSFMGWYQLFDDGTLASVPFDFNTQVENDITIQAQWRLDGGYYLKYNPKFYDEVNQKLINGNIDQWNDPADPNQQLYVDRSITSILNAPTNVTPGYVFRGWRVVRASGTIPGTTYSNWEPIQFDNKGDSIYYQPGSDFRIESELVSEIIGAHSIINMQAVYEEETSSARRPKVTNLIIDSNENYEGYYTISDSNNLPALIGTGNRSFNPDPPNKDDEGYYTQVLIGDFQSNEVIHLSDYANILGNHNDYLLIGFDEGSDEIHAYDETSAPNGLRSGSPFIPTFATDSVVAVTRDDQRTLYAIWEPMIYVTFVNDTAEDIEINLSNVGSIVNEVKNFDRSSLSNKITVPSNSSVKVVLPDSTVGDNFTATVTNNHLGKLMSVGGEYPIGTKYGIGHDDIPENYQVIYTGELVYNANGIVVTYTEDDTPKSRVFFDMNVAKGGNTTWTETSNDYVDLSGNGEVYSITKEAITNYHAGQYKPSDPTSSDNGNINKVFIGWTDNADIAAHTDFSSTKSSVKWGQTTITVDTGSNVLEKVKSDYLWDFSQTLPPDGDLTLYAVWSDKVTVTFDLIYTDDNNLHNWEGPQTTSDTTATYAYYRSSPTDKYVTYTMAKGDKVPKPNDPTPNTLTGYFYKWLKGSDTYDFARSTVLKIDTNANRTTFKNCSKESHDFDSFVNENVRLITSWFEDSPQTFTFTVENQVTNGNPNEEFTYNIVVSDEEVYGKRGTSNSSSLGAPDRHWGSFTTTLKSGQIYTVLVKVSYYNEWGGDYSVWIDVIDEDGNVIKSNPVIYCNKNTLTDYASDYHYTLTISQEEKTGYNTTVTVDNVDADELVNPTDTIVFDPPVNNSFTFYQGQSRAHNRCLPEQNTYDAGEKNSLRILFTNQGTAIPAPTNYSTNSKPFFMMFGFGAILLGIIVAPIVMLRRRKEEEE